MIVILLLTSGLWDMSVPSHSNQTAGHGFDFDGFKVMASMVLHIICFLCVLASLLANNVTQIARFLPPIVIVTVMVFNSIFNIGAAGALWFHHAPDYPGGYSRAIRGGAAMSSAVFFISLIVIGVFCYQYPAHPSLKDLGNTRIGNFGQPKEGSKEGVKKSAEGKKKKKKKSSEVKKKGDKKGSKESQEVSAPGKASGEETEGDKQKTPSKEAIPDAAQQEPKPPSLKKDPNQKDFQYFEPPKPPEEAPNQLEKPRAPGEGAQE